MALQTPDMNACTQKYKCLSGVNSGLAYDITAPCPKDGLLVFDPVECDCVPFVITNRMRMVHLGGTTRVPPNTVMITQPAPYFDAQGRLITYTLGLGRVSAAWSGNCSDSISVYEKCIWGTSVTATKTNNCTGGASYVLMAHRVKYIDGAYNSFEWTYFSSDATQCGAPIGNTQQATVKYQQEISPGVWVDI